MRPRASYCVVIWASCAHKHAPVQLHAVTGARRVIRHRWAITARPSWSTSFRFSIVILLTFNEVIDSGADLPEREAPVQ